MTLRVTASFATVFTCGALILVALAFCTDHWLEYTFYRDKVKASIKDGTAPNPALLSASLNVDPLMFTRNRGLFRTCYMGNETAFMDGRVDVIDLHCLPETGYELVRNQKTVAYPSDYTTRIHLMRAHFAMFVCSMLMLLIGCIAGGVGCLKLSKRSLLTAGLTVFAGAFFNALGMAVFHGYEYLEKEKIGVAEFPKGWSSVIVENTKTDYGWSYIVGWLGMALATVGAMLYLCASYSITSAKYEEKRALGSYTTKTPPGGYSFDQAEFLYPGYAPPPDYPHHPHDYQHHHGHHNRQPHYSFHTASAAGYPIDQYADYGAYRY